MLWLMASWYTEALGLQKASMHHEAQPKPGLAMQHKEASWHARTHKAQHNSKPFTTCSPAPAQQHGMKGFVLQEFLSYILKTFAVQSPTQPGRVAQGGFLPSWEVTASLATLSLPTLNSKAPASLPFAMSNDLHHLLPPTSDEECLAWPFV